MRGVALVVCALFVSACGGGGGPRPYRRAGYPWLPAIYIAAAVCFVLSTLLTRPRESLAGLSVACLGIPLYVYWRRPQRRA
jgi:APA family basic amino acid/polyamine antiporter